SRGKHPLPALSRFADELSGIAEQQIRPSGNHQPRFLPDHKVVLVSITCVARNEIYKNVSAVGRSSQLQAKIQLGSQRVHRLHPGFRPTNLTNVPDARKLPECPLPLGYLGGETDYVSGPAAAPMGPDSIQQQRGLLTLEDGQKRAQVFSAQPPL